MRIAIVGRSEARVGDALVACEKVGVLCTMSGLGDGVHPSELPDELARAGEPVVTTMSSPYMLDHFDAENVWCLLRSGEDVVAARLSDHPDWAEWVGLLQVGEFWASVGESWVAEADHLVGFDALARQIAADLDACSSGADGG